MSNVHCVPVGDCISMLGTAPDTAALLVVIVVTSISVMSKLGSVSVCLVTPFSLNSISVPSCSTTTVAPSVEIV